jgi:hypothetical protein
MHKKNWGTNESPVLIILSGQGRSRGNAVTVARGGIALTFIDQK